MKTFVLSIALMSASGLLMGQIGNAMKKMTTGGILHPEMTVGADAGTYDAPMGTIGMKVTEPWTGTTIAAGVDKKPQTGKPMTVVGEIIDMSCYLQLGKHGEKHKACGTKCITNNQAIGVLTKNGDVYMIVEEEHDPRRDGTASVRQDAIKHFAHIMEVNGTEAAHDGFKAIFVQGYVKQ